MSHDKTQAAARTRMAKTGEPYAAARRAVIEEHQAAEGQGLPVPHPDYLITPVGYGEGAGAGVPGAAVRDAASGEVVDRLPGRMDVYSAVAGSGGGRVFFLAMLFGRERIADSDPEAGQIPPGGAVRVQLDDRGKIADLSAVPGVPEPAHVGPIHLAASADGGRLAYPVRDRRGAPAADAPPAQISIVAVTTGERTVWQAESDGHIEHVSLSADGRRLAYSWHGLGEGNGIRVTDLPDTAAGGVVTTPSRLVVPQHNSLGNLGGAVISPDGARLYVTAARYGPGGQPVTRLAEISAADGGQVCRIAYERPGADLRNTIFGWDRLAIDSSDQHALISYSGNLGRIELSTGHFTELPMDENLASDIAW